MRGRRTLVGVVLAVLATAPVAHAQSSYCDGDGGPQGRATDAEHSVLFGDPALPPGVISSRVNVGGISTRVLQAGPAWSEDAVVFVHGSPDSSREWDGLMAESGRFTRAIAFDVSGYGKSDKVAPPEVQTTGGVARYMQGLLDQLGVKRAVLVVHDFGGQWGLSWAVAHLGSLRGAVLIDGGALIDYTPHPDSVAFATPGVGEQEMATTFRDNFVARVRSGNPRMPELYVQRLYDNYDRASRCAILRYYRSASENFQTLGREQAAALRPLDLPALVVWGKQDPYVPPEQAEKQKQAFPSARIVMFDDSAHWPHIDNADRTRDAVVPFLRPRLGVARVLGAKRGARALRVRLRVGGPLPALRMAVRLERGGRRLGASRRVRFVSQAGSVPIRLRHALRPGLHTLIVSARGADRERFAFRVR